MSYTGLNIYQLTPHKWFSVFDGILCDSDNWIVSAVYSIYSLKRVPHM